MKQYKNYIFLESLGDCVRADCSDGYLTNCNGDKKIKLPHKNYTVLGIVQECYDSPYSEEFSKEIVLYVPMSGDEGYSGYWDYKLDAWGATLDTAAESFKTLMTKLDLKPTDYILRDEK